MVSMKINGAFFWEYGLARDIRLILFDHGFIVQLTVGANLTT